MDSYDLLVIVLAVALAIFLTLSIWAMIYVIKIVKSIRNITEKAEHIAVNVDSVSTFFKNTATPVAIGKLISNIVDMFNGRKEKDKDK